MLDLKNIELFCIDDVESDRVLDILDICNYYSNFKSINFLTSKEINSCDYNVIKIEPITNINGYSDFLLKKLVNYISSDYVLIVQWDGFILNPNSFNSEFLKYDYLGAPWKLGHSIVGNGGFSLRTKKLFDVVANLLNNNVTIKEPEDFVICGYLREILERKYNIKFPSVEFAKTFAVEDEKIWTGQFGFHSFTKVDPFNDGWIPPNLNYRTERFKNHII